ncbi:FadR/GntR family transcriptional regulator [Sinomonas sp. G460-2]|uniref:FadR/GntR family transcriptional regulator n=1 Tax=Sinomonas sp. G460-2 TaxID=3393464 RepID=UPI0039EE108E
MAGSVSGRTTTSPGAAEDIADRIQEFIIAEGLEAGARLPSERDLAVILSISRPIVSQAVRILVVRGLVESRRGSGMYVTRQPEGSLASSVNLMLNLNQESIGQLSDLRLWLETIGVLQAIEHRTDELLESSQRALDRLRLDSGDVAAWMSADTLFHATLVRGSRNPYLASIYESVHVALIDYEYRAWIDTGTVPSWLQPSESDAMLALHEPILQSVRDRDPDAARAAILSHHEAMARHLAASHGTAETLPSRAGAGSH